MKQMQNNPSKNTKVKKNPVKLFRTTFYSY